LKIVAGNTGSRGVRGLDTLRRVTTVRPPGGHRGVWLGVGIAASGIAIVAVLAMLAVPVLGFFVWMFLGPDSDDAKATAGDYLQRLEAKDDAGAYALLCADTRRDTDQAAFTGLVEAGPRPAGHEVTAGHLDEAGRHGDVDVVLTDATGATRPLHLRLTYANRKWSVCGDELIERAWPVP
jgi:hypothetical protein